MTTDKIICGSEAANWKKKGFMWASHSAILMLIENMQFHSFC